MNDDERLLEAYRGTSFFADTPKGRIELRIGLVATELAELLTSLGLRTWAYVTAFNPESERLSDDENGRRHLQLIQRVADLGLTAFPGEGVGDDREWPPERSLLIVGADRTMAADLGRQFGQLAVVCGSLGLPAELLVIRGDHPADGSSRR